MQPWRKKLARGEFEWGKKMVRKWKEWGKSEALAAAYSGSLMITSVPIFSFELMSIVPL